MHFLRLNYICDGVLNVTKKKQNGKTTEHVWAQYASLQGSNKTKKHAKIKSFKIIKLYRE